MRIDIISVQPKMFEGFLTESIVARAVRKGACAINIVDLREFGEGRWRKVDDKPYGGGPGMLMKCGPWFAAVEACLGVRGDGGAPNVRVIMTSPAGKRFTQRDAEHLASLSHPSSPVPHLIFLCGHYEGFDARIETLVTDMYSVGDFVMTGGELAAAAMVDSIVRLLPGVLGGGPSATASESFGRDGLLEPPQYTHPPEFRGMRVPEVLLSGDHAKIETWKRAEARKVTKRVRPDLISLCLCTVVFLLAFVVSAAEIRAVWDHSGKGLYEGDWPRTMKVLKEAHVTDLYLNVGGVDFAHYASAFLPKSLAFRKRGDQLTAALGAAREAGVRVHAWFICFNATRNVPSTLNAFLRKGWRLRSETGGFTTYLDPANAGVRSRVLAAIDELTRYPVAGVHLDFVRYGDKTAKPAKAAEVVASFVAEARRHVKRPKVLSAAVYGRYPSCIVSVGQDWPKWIDFDIVDYVVPMDYTDNLDKFRDLLAAQKTSSARAKRTVIGIGVTATGLHLSPWQVVEQVRLARRNGFAGLALFDLDGTLERSIFPALRRHGW